MTVRPRTLATSAVFCCGLFFVSSAAFAASLSSADQDFLVSTAQGATYELATAKLALTKTSRSDIKRYAHTMIADHERLNPALHRLARKNGVDLPTTMTDDKKSSFDHLKGLDGQAFDTAFVNDEAEDNRNDVSTEQKELDTTDDASVKAFVKQLQAADAKHTKLGEALQNGRR